MWQSRIFWRLFGAYSLVVTLALGFLGWLLIGRIETHLLEEVRHHLEMKTLLLRVLVEDRTPLQLQKMATRLAGDMNARITLIATDGLVLADSSENPGTMENHKDRPEVQEAEEE